jgi:signal transduction histidine kinase
LKRPLTRLKSGLELALNDADRHGAGTEVISQALVDIDGVLKTLNALMDIARAESGLGHEHLERLDLSELAASLSDIYAPLLEHKGASIATSLEGGAYIRGHRELLTQAIVNLLENAARFTPKGSVLSVAVARAGHTVDLRIADGGPGIPAGERERVLERFVRLDGARSDDGSGLGLSLVAAVAKLHGARLSLEDNEPGLRVVLTFDRSEVEGS